MYFAKPTAFRVAAILFGVYFSFKENIALSFGFESSLSLKHQRVTYSLHPAHAQNTRADGYPPPEFASAATNTTRQHYH